MALGTAGATDAAHEQLGFGSLPLLTKDKTRCFQPASTEQLGASAAKNSVDPLRREMVLRLGESM